MELWGCFVSAIAVTVGGGRWDETHVRMSAMKLNILAVFVEF